MSHSLIKRKSRNDGWEEKGGYMQAKVKKLHDQFQNESVIQRKSNIFKSVSIWVNGYTHPSSDELKRLVGENGGQYQHFFSKTHVTHVIATNLTSSKIKDLKKNDQVVHPDWIVDSVSAGKLLPVDKYLLYSVNKRDGTKLKFRGATTKTSLDGDSLHSCNRIISKVSNSEDVFKGKELFVPHLSKHEYNGKANPSLKAGDPNFISEYYAHSRLHHLSMWKAELKKFTADIQKRKKQFVDEPIKKNMDKLVMHVDMDSFFVSVALTVDQSLKGKPVAVCHSNKSSGAADSWSSIASCSYEARCYGIKNGMMLNKAKSLCPTLICVPYHFDQYRKVSQKVYEILSNYTCEIEAVSCDEALLDVSQIAGNNVIDLAEQIRNKIFEETQCTASCGISENILLARLATKHAKPNGVCYIQKSDVSEFIANQKVCDLPGVGASHGDKLLSLSIRTCADLQKFSLLFLKKEFGPKLGETLYNFSRGKDSRPLKLEDERKSVSAEINYGMRFNTMKEVEEFVEQLSRQVEIRLKEVGKKGKLITFKMMTRQKGEGAPLKYMGHGLCDNISKSVTLPTPTNSAVLLSQYCFKLLHAITVSAQDIRGMGIQVTKLTDATQNTAVDLFQFANTSEIINNHNNQIKHDDAILEEEHFSKTNKEQNIFHQPPLAFSLTGKSSNEGQPEGESDLWNLSVLNQLPSDIREELLQQVPTTTKNKSISLKMSKPTSLMKSSTNKNNLKSPEKKNNEKSPADKNKNSIGKSRRGRPRKIDQLFDSTKYRDMKVSSLTNTHEKKLLLSPSSVDINTLNELPEEIRKEIVAEMKSVQIVSKYKKKDFKPTNQVQSEVKNNHSAETNLNQVSFVLFQKPEESTSLQIPAISAPLQKPVVSLSLQKNVDGTDGVSDIYFFPSQLNESFMKALPEDIQNELLQSIERVRKNETCSDVLKQTEKEIPCFTPTFKDIGASTPIPSIVPSLVVSSDKRVTNCEGTNSNSFDILSPSQLDLSVFNELPVELQREVMMAARSNKNRNIRNKEKQRFLTNVDQITAKKEIPLQVKLVQVIPIFCGLTSISELKTHFQKWIQLETEPFQEDIEEVKRYNQLLIKSYHIETLQILLQHFRRLASKYKHWNSIFNEVLSDAQQHMKFIYNGRLNILQFANGADSSSVD